MRSPLVRMLGFPGTLIHGDTLVLDRWRWLADHLPEVPKGSRRLLDVGCGSGAFTIGAAVRGYDALGLSWDERNQRIARERAAQCGAPGADFIVCDVRRLDRAPDLRGQFDVIVCTETIEHVLDDAKLMRDMSACLRPDGTLLLTTPNVEYRPMGGDEGPFRPVEDGAHVRRGYSDRDLARLCAQAGLRVERVGYCSGVLSQKITWLARKLGHVHPMFAWALTLPLRPLPPLFDAWATRATGWPGYSITLVARRAA